MCLWLSKLWLLCFQPKNVRICGSCSCLTLTTSYLLQLHWALVSLWHCQALQLPFASHTFLGSSWIVFLPQQWTAGGPVSLGCAFANVEVYLVCKGVLNEGSVSGCIPINARIQGFPVEYCTLAWWSVAFTSTVSGLNVVAVWYMYASLHSMKSFMCMLSSVLDGLCLEFIEVYYIWCYCYSLLQPNVDCVEHLFSLHVCCHMSMSLYTFVRVWVNVYVYIFNNIGPHSPSSVLKFIKNSSLESRRVR